MNGRTTTRRLVAVLALVAIPMTGCGSSDEAVPTADELVAALLTPGDLDGTWTVNAGPEELGGGSGLVTEEQQAALPRLGFCDDASEASRAADADLRWLAFRQLDLAAEDPIEPPTDRVGHMAFVQEYVTAGDPAGLSTTFAALRDGAEACFGDIPAGEEGPGFSAPLTIPDLGDERFGAQMTLGEAGGWAEWHLSYGVVRDGPVLLTVVVTDITAGTEPLWTGDDLADMFRIAAARL